MKRLIVCLLLAVFGTTVHAQSVLITLNYVVTGGGGAELRPLRCGIPGKRRCKNPPLAFFNEHHYVRLDVLPGALQLCPRRLDGSALEECLTLRLPPRS